MTDPPSAWSARHHGLDPARVPLLRGWLRGVDVLARPLASAGVPPMAVTVAGAVLAVTAALLVPGLPWLGLVLVAASVTCDAVDGTLAQQADRVSAAGARADAVADRVADVAFAAVVWRCGAPLWLAALAGGLSLAHEAYRAVRGGRLRVRVTVDERPGRAICTLLAAGTAGVSDAAWPPTVCAAVWAGLGLVGLAQLAVTRA